MVNNFYVYIHRDKLTNAVFYVGKGKGGRAFDTKSRSSFWKKYVKKHEYIVEFVEQDIQEWYAFELERNLIAYYGRRDDGTGSLLNLTDGGEGHSNPTTETRVKLRESKLGDKNPSFGKTTSDKQKEAARAACLNREVSQLTRQKLSASRKGRKASESQLEKMRLARLGKTLSEETILKIKNSLQASQDGRAVVCVETGEVYRTMSEAARSLRNLYPRAAMANISRAAHGGTKKAYGFTWRFLDENIDLKCQG